MPRLLQSLRRAAAFALATFSLAGTAAAQSADVTRIIMPFAAGGATDVLTRKIAEKMQRATGQTFIVVNQPGANGNIGAGNTTRAAPDGKTFAVTSSAFATVNPILFKDSMRFEPAELDMLTIIGVQPAVLVVNANSGIKSLAELMAKARAGGISYASAGIGSPGHLTMAYLGALAGGGLKMTHVPYTGGAPAMAALLGGQVDVTFIIAGNVIPQVQAGKLTPLAVSSKRRMPQLPNVPTIAESGFAGYEVEDAVVAIVPAGTPADVKERLASQIRAAVDTPDLRQDLESKGFLTMNSTPSEARAWFARERDRWADLLVKRQILKD